MKCLLCYKPLLPTETDYHNRCVKSVFGLPHMPVINLDEKNLTTYAKAAISAKTAVAGVQPKLSLWLERNAQNIRPTIKDNKSNYIIKPQSETYIALPENEDLCMHLARISGIKTATHGLVRTPAGKLAYITKRFDRQEDGTKLACEDLCQLTETLTEHKYRGSYELVGETIKKYSSQPGLDAVNFFQVVVFSFITGNADMHLKNFSLLENNDGIFALSPTYDLVCTLLVIKNEKDEMALNINGRKKSLYKKSFDHLAEVLGLDEKAVNKIYRNFIDNSDETIWWVDNSFVPEDQKAAFKKLFNKRVKLFNAFQ